MTNKDIEQLYKRARSVAWHMTKSNEMVEDFPAYAVIRAMRLPENSRILLRYYLVDFIRETKGRIKSKRPRHVCRNMTDLDIDRIIPETASSEDWTSINEIVNTALKSMLPVERQIFIQLLEGYTFKEIGKSHGLTQSRISQIYARRIVPKYLLAQSR